MAAKKHRVDTRVDPDFALSVEDLSTIILVLLLHQGARMKAAAEVPGMSSRELNAFGKEQERLKNLRERLEVMRCHLED